MRKCPAGWKSAMVCCFVIGLACIFMLPGNALPAKKGRPAAASLQKDSKVHPGKVSCSECHKTFYEHWSVSRHGLSVRPFSPAFARDHLQSPGVEVVVGENPCRAHWDGDEGWMIERGKKGDMRYKIHHVMGGRSVYYFLTSLQDGRLQVMPLAYDIRAGSWFNVLQSAVRHFIERGEEPLDWRDALLTFNIACFQCHVAQNATNYDEETETYRNVLTEPGIRCSACHGPTDAHVKAVSEMGKGQPPQDLKINDWNSFSPQQKSEGCAPCHGRTRPLTNTFKPGERFFDHYDLIALEDPDFFPDGTDRGENHVYTRWLMNPCAGAGQLECTHCHMPGGQYRFGTSEKANEVCLPCHEERVRNASAHSNHPEESEGNRCVACHMPKIRGETAKARDHAMLPPCPAATLAFQSPNACNGCHRDRDAAWSDEWVRKRQPRDYQAPILERARLVDAARRRDWGRLADILKFIGNKEHEPVTAVSLIRLLAFCDDDRKWPVLTGALESRSPFVRAAAAEGLAGSFAPEILHPLLKATEDEYRLVRVRSAMALSAYPRTMLGEADFQRLERASMELVDALEVRPDDWESHYTLGNYLLNREYLPASLVAYDAASRLNPRRTAPLLNASIAAARLGEMNKAEEFLQRALKIEPASPVIHFHMALLRADQGDYPRAESHLREALKADPQMAEAACNLCVLLARDRLEEALQWCRRAHEIDPENGKYAYTLAFYERKSGNTEVAGRILRELTDREPIHVEAVLLLCEILEEQGMQKEAREMLARALTRESLASRDRYRLFLKVQEMEKRESPPQEGEAPRVRREEDAGKSPEGKDGNNPGLEPEGVGS
ncbi:MAG: ammonia-forming cytochrome c nitrite reductase subunit c552 [Deltaproteobacteria bacterium]|nr:ammonia-forming cytochrome c nitrite reductase subunit c552 [Deltaproteobacteria bacterium]